HGLFGRWQGAGRDLEPDEGSHRLRAYDLVELAGRNLREAILRNSLTTLGIGVGVASLVAMLSLGLGLQKLFNRQLRRSGLFDTIFVTARRDVRNTRAGGQSDAG